MDSDNKTTKEPDILKDHAYDGIQEYDNPLPNWWLMTFFGTIIFGFLYYIHYEWGGGPTLKQELAQEVAELKEQVAANESANGSSPSTSKVPEDEEGLKAVFSKSENVSAGKAIFAGKCASCHGEHGEGQIGPNLTDDFWILGDGSRVAIINTIRKGSLEKGMPAWEAMMSPEEVIQVGSFVYSLNGTKPAKGKVPQGNEHKRM